MLKQNRKMAIIWMWHFIRQNKRIPVAGDLTGLNSPGLKYVISEFGSIDKLVDLSGPPQKISMRASTFLELRDNFEKFNKEFGHYPTVAEIDNSPCFPKSRSIERTWGGVRQLRKLFNHPVIDFSEGLSRSAIAKTAGDRGFVIEKEMEEVLVKEYGEEFVHIEKRWDKDSKSRLDFYVYSSSGNFGIDVFFPSSIHNLRVQLEIKNNQYVQTNFPLYLVYANNKIDTKDVLSHVENKSNPLRANMRVRCLGQFYEEIKKQFIPYKIKSGLVYRHKF